MLANKKKDVFQNFRMKAVRLTKIPLEFVEPLVDRVLSALDGQLLHATEVFDNPLLVSPRAFNSLVCEECGEMVVEK